jgi:hypothetical protein
MQQSSSWKSSSCSTSHETPHLLWNTQVRYHDHKSVPLNPIPDESSAHACTQACSLSLSLSRARMHTHSFFVVTDLLKGYEPINPIYKQCPGQGSKKHEGRGIFFKPSRLVKSPCCACLPFNFWTNGPSFMNYGMNIMPLEAWQTHKLMRWKQHQHN